MFLRVLNTVFLNISIYLPHLEPRNRSIKIVVVMNFVVITNVSIKRFDCILLIIGCHNDVVKVVELACKHDVVIIPFGGKFV